ncbi:hypothetical protein [Streptomyces sp. NPDC048659]|uniref:hypothetical protein n=1 Tax=Streptomyces sp. NPDC048659 TaxID=3155489 RepID=UPI003426454B
MPTTRWAAPPRPDPAAPAPAPTAGTASPCSGSAPATATSASSTRAPPATPPALVCTLPGAAQLNIEQLDPSGSGGSGVGVRKVAGLRKVEGPGGYWDPVARLYVLTYADPACGYCAGTPIGYATAPSLYSGWEAPGNVGWSAPANGRRVFDANSCGGQPRTVSVVDGRPWQVIDLWLGTRNEAAAATHLVPLAYTPRAGAAGDGAVWRPPLALAC